MNYQKEQIYREMYNFIGIYIDTSTHKLLFEYNDLSDKDLDFLAYKQDQSEKSEISEKIKKTNDYIVENYRRISNKLDMLYQSKEINKDTNKKIMALLREYCNLK